MIMHVVSRIHFSQFCSERSAYLETVSIYTLDETWIRDSTAPDRRFSGGKTLYFAPRDRLLSTRKN